MVGFSVKVVSKGNVAIGKFENGKINLTSVVGLRSLIGGSKIGNAVTFGSNDDGSNDVSVGTDGLYDGNVGTRSFSGGTMGSSSEDIGSIGSGNEVKSGEKEDLYRVIRFEIQRIVANCKRASVSE